MHVSTDRNELISRPRGGGTARAPGSGAVQRGSAIFGMAALLAAIELLAVAGWGLPDPRPVLLLGVVAVALFAGRIAAVVAVVATLLYVVHYEWAGHAAASVFGPGVRLAVYAVAAPALAAVVLLLQGGAARRLTSAVNSAVDSAVASERLAGSARVEAGEELNRAILASLPAHIAVVDSTGAIVSTNGAWDRFAIENAGQGPGAPPPPPPPAAA